MRLRTILTLAGMAAVLSGCVYDPYTGTYVPCCNYYGYPYGYAYPRPYYRPAPYAYPQGGYPQGGYPQGGTRGRRMVVRNKGHMAHRHLASRVPAGLRHRLALRRTRRIAAGWRNASLPPT